MGNKRNTGIELLKIVSMLMVVTLHVLLFGINYYEAHVLTPKGFITNMIEVLCYCAVNVYTIITGYLMVDKNLKSIVSLIYIKKDIAQNKVLLIG